MCKANINLTSPKKLHILLINDLFYLTDYCKDYCVHCHGGAQGLILQPVADRGTTNGKLVFRSANLKRASKPIVQT